VISRTAGVSVIIPTMGQRFLDRCLASLVDQSDRAFEVIVVENGYRHPDTPRILMTFAGRLHLRYRFVARPGANLARNVGIRLASMPVIALLDDDCVADRHWVGAIRDAHGGAAAPAVVGGAVRLDPIGDEPTWLCGTLKKTLSELDWGDRARELVYPEYLVAANMSLGATTVARVGGFRADIGHNSRAGPQLGNDEIELIHRCWRHDVPILYHPEIRVRHLIPAARWETGSLGQRWYGQGWSDMVLANLGHDDASGLVASLSSLLQRSLREARDGGRSSVALRSCRSEALRGASDFAAATLAAPPGVRPVGVSAPQRRSYLPDYPDWLALATRLRRYPSARATGSTPAMEPDTGVTGALEMSAAIAPFLAPSGPG